MLRVRDRVYLHIGDLKNGINKAGYNRDRVCEIKEIKPIVLDNGEEAGLYVLKAMHCDKEYKVLADDKIWIISPIEDLIEVIKISDYDVIIKEKILEELYL